MTMQIPVGITALGSYFPQKVYDNAHFQSYLDTSEEWIFERTGILTRHIAAENQASSDLGFEAAKQALEMRGMAAEELQCIIVASVTPDMMFPATACIVQDKLEAYNAWCFDLSAACSGYVYALQVALSLVGSGQYRNVLVIGVDVMSSILDYQDRSTCILFGDGAGATLVEPLAEVELGFIDSLLLSDGRGGQYLKMPAGGSRMPTSAKTVEERLHCVKQDGKKVFKHAFPEMAKVSLELLRRNGFTVDDLDLFVPHQANNRIIESCAKEMKIPREKVIVTIERYANTTAATIPTCLHEAFHTGRLDRGDLVQLTTFGAGFTWGSILLRWNLERVR